MAGFWLRITFAIPSGGKIGPTRVAPGASRPSPSGVRASPSFDDPFELGPECSRRVEGSGIFGGAARGSGCGASIGGGAVGTSPPRGEAEAGGFSSARGAPAKADGRACGAGALAGDRG